MKRFILHFNPFLVSCLFNLHLLSQDVARGQLSILPPSSLCKFGTSFVDKYIGEMKLDSQVYCTPGANRHLSGKSCCLPEKPSASKPQLYLFLKEKKWSQRLDWRDSSSLVNATPYYVNRYILLVPGMYDSIASSSWLIPAVGIISRIGYPVIIADWTDGLTNFWQANANVRSIGAALAYWMINNDLITRISIIGFGHGGQMIHEVARYIADRSYDKISECIALDPVGIGFDGGPIESHLNPGDCEIVQSIHTEATSFKEFYDSRGARTIASTVKNGNCDWWFNCGKIQGQGVCRSPSTSENLAFNGLPIISEISKSISNANQFSCSNLLAPSYLLAEISNRCNFKGFPCYDCGDSRDASKCQFDNQAEPVPFLACSPYENSSYYVYSPSFPFC